MKEEELFRSLKDVMDRLKDVIGDDGRSIVEDCVWFSQEDYDKGKA